MANKRKLPWLFSRLSRFFLRSSRDAYPWPAAIRSPGHAAVKFMNASNLPDQLRDFRDAELAAFHKIMDEGYPSMFEWIEALNSP
jgi:hypothetical protein